MMISFGVPSVKSTASSISAWAAGRSGERCAEGSQRPVGALPVAIVGGELVQTHEIQQLDRVAGRLGAVEARFLPSQHRLVGVARSEEPAVGVLEAGREGTVQIQRGLEPPRLAGRLIEIQQCGKQERMVVEVGRDARLAADVAPQQPIPVPEVRQDEVGRRGGAVGIRRLAEHERRLRQRRDRQTVPRRQDLVVTERRGALRPRRVERLARRVEHPPSGVYLQLELGGDLGQRTRRVQDAAPRRSCRPA